MRRAAIHWKKSMTSTPRITESSKSVQMGKHVGRGTIEKCADKVSSKRGLLRKVLVFLDLWSTGIIGPRLIIPLGDGRHNLDMYGERRNWAWGEWAEN